MIVNLLSQSQILLNFENEHDVINCENIENFARPQQICS